MQKQVHTHGMRDRNLRRWIPALALLGAALLALLVRMAYLKELNGSPLLSVLLGDGRQYDAWAQQIAGGQWVGTEIFYQTPLYPYWLAVIFSIAGHNLDLVRLIQAILGAASCVLLGLAGRRFFSDRVGVIAALLLAVYPPAFFFDGLIQKSSLDIFLVTLALVLLAEFDHRPDWKWLAALGATTAALVLNRENALVLYPVIGAWLLFLLPQRSDPPPGRVGGCFCDGLAGRAVARRPQKLPCRRRVPSDDLPDGIEFLHRQQSPRPRQLRSRWCRSTATPPTNGTTPRVSRRKRSAGFSLPARCRTIGSANRSPTSEVNRSNGWLFWERRCSSRSTRPRFPTPNPLKRIPITPAYCAG